MTANVLVILVGAIYLHGSFSLVAKIRLVLVVHNGIISLH